VPLKSAAFLFKTREAQPGLFPTSHFHSNSSQSQHLPASPFQLPVRSLLLPNPLTPYLLPFHTLPPLSPTQSCKHCQTCIDICSCSSSSINTSTALSLSIILPHSSRCCQPSPLHLPSWPSPPHKPPAPQSRSRCPQPPLQPSTRATSAAPTHVSTCTHLKHNPT
jgi:hypothetical protein